MKKYKTFAKNRKEDIMKLAKIVIHEISFEVGTNYVIQNGSNDILDVFDLPFTLQFGRNRELKFSNGVLGDLQGGLGKKYTFKNFQDFTIEDLEKSRMKQAARDMFGFFLQAKWGIWTDSEEYTKCVHFDPTKTKVIAVGWPSYLFVKEITVKNTEIDSVIMIEFHFKRIKKTYDHDAKVEKWLNEIWENKGVENEGGRIAKGEKTSAAKHMERYDYMFNTSLDNPQLVFQTFIDFIFVKCEEKCDLSSKEFQEKIYDCCKFARPFEKYFSCVKDQAKRIHFEFSWTIFQLVNSIILSFD